MGIGQEHGAVLCSGAGLQSQEGTRLWDWRKDCRVGGSTWIGASFGAKGRGLPRSRPFAEPMLGPQHPTSHHCSPTCLSCSTHHTSNRPTPRRAPTLPAVPWVPTVPTVPVLPARCPPARWLPGAATMRGVTDCVWGCTRPSLISMVKYVFMPSWAAVGPVPAGRGPAGGGRCSAPPLPAPLAF